MKAGPRRLVWIAVTVGLTSLFDMVLPLENTWFLLPLFALVSVSSGQFADQAPAVLHYHKKDFNRGVIVGLARTGTTTLGMVIVFPQWTIQLLVYSSAFYVMNSTLRTTLEATSFIFYEETRTGVALLKAYSVTRLTYFAATPLILLSLTTPTPFETAALAVVWSVTMLPQLVFLPWSGIFSPYPIMRYVGGSTTVELELRVLQKLKNGPLSEKQLLQRLRTPREELQPLLAHMGRRWILQRANGKWDLGPFHRGTLIILKRREKWKRAGGKPPNVSVY